MGSFTGFKANMPVQHIAKVSVAEYCLFYPSSAHGFLCPIFWTALGVFTRHPGGRPPLHMGVGRCCPDEEHLTAGSHLERIFSFCTRFPSPSPLRRRFPQRRARPSPSLAFRPSFGSLYQQDCPPDASSPSTRSPRPLTPPAPRHAHYSVHCLDDATISERCRIHRRTNTDHPRASAR